MEITGASLYVEGNDVGEIARHGYSGKGKFIEVLDAFFRLVSMIYDPAECNGEEEDDEHDDDEDSDEDEEESSCEDTACYGTKQHEELIAAQNALKELLGKQLLGKIKAKPDGSQADLDAMDAMEAINKIYAETYRAYRVSDNESADKILLTMRYWPKLTFVNKDLLFELSQEVAICDDGAEGDGSSIECTVSMQIDMRRGAEPEYHLGVFANPEIGDADYYQIQPYLARRLYDILLSVEGGK